MQQYANEDSFRTYVDYLALKKHFTTDNYDYFKYHGKVRTSFDKFLTRPDAIFFNKLAAKPEARNLMVANIVKNPSVWVRDLCGDESREIYLAWKKNIDSLTRTFSDDLKKLDENYKSNFVVTKKEQYPKVLRLYMQRQITLETFSILVVLSNVKDYWIDAITDKFIAKDLIRLGVKYFPFLEIDNKKFADIIKSVTTRV